MVRGTLTQWNRQSKHIYDSLYSLFLEKSEKQRILCKEESDIFNKIKQLNEYYSDSSIVEEVYALEDELEKIYEELDFARYKYDLVVDQQINLYN